MTAAELLVRVDGVMVALDYLITPNLLPFAGEPPEIRRPKSYTAFYAAFGHRMPNAHCIDATDTLVVQTLLLFEGRVGQDAYRAQVLPQRDAVVDGLFGLDEVVGPITGDFAETPDGLGIRTTFNVPVAYSRTAA